MQKIWITTALLTLASVFAHAEEAVIRPQAGIGYLDNARYQHAGLRVLLDAGATKKYGLELSHLSTGNTDYIAAGIVLEQKKLGWFNMSIGTICYFAQRQATPNAPGLVANLGWEPDTRSAIKPFVTLRNDILFAEKTRIGYSLSAGLSASF